MENRTNFANKYNRQSNSGRAGIRGLTVSSCLWGVYDFSFKALIKRLFLFWSWQKGFFCKSSNMIWQLVFVIFHLLAESVFNTRLWMEEAILEFPATCGFWFEEDWFQRKSHIHYKSQRRRRSMTRPSDTCQPYPKDLATSHFGRRLPVPGDDSSPNKSANDLSIIVIR